MEMSSEGPKMVEMSYGVAGNGRKIKKIPVTHGGRRRRFAGPILARPAAVGRENFTDGFIWMSSSHMSGVFTVKVAGIDSVG